MKWIVIVIALVTISTANKDVPDQPIRQIFMFDNQTMAEQWCDANAHGECTIIHGELIKQ